MGKTINDIRGICIKGANFAEPQNLEFFKNQKKVKNQKKLKYVFYMEEMDLEKVLLQEELEKYVMKIKTYMKI